MRGGEAKTLYLDAATASVRVDGDALRVRMPDEAERFVPLARIGRAVVTGGTEDLLQACLSIVARGGVVHFESGNGRTTAVLQNANPAENDGARELAGLIESHDGLGPFLWWRDAQRRHAWSLVFRRGIRGDFESNRKKLELYTASRAPGVPVPREIARLERHLHGWVQAEIHRQGLQPVTRALAGKGGDLVTVLRECLGLSLCWAYARWRRHQPAEISDQELTRFFELRTAAPLPEQLERHLRALAGEYHASWSRLCNGTAQKDE